MPDVQSYYKQIESIMRDHGFGQVNDRESSEFKAAYTRRKFRSTLVFLVKQVDAQNVGTSSISTLVETGKQWCEDNLKATFLPKAAGLNLIILHTGAAGSHDITDQIDLTGLHRIVCTSITIIDTANGNIETERTWVLNDPVKRVIHKLKALA